MRLNEGYLHCGMNQSQRTLDISSVVSALDHEICSYTAVNSDTVSILRAGIWFSLLHVAADGWSVVSSVFCFISSNVLQFLLNPQPPHPAHDFFLFFFLPLFYQIKGLYIYIYWYIMLKNRMNHLKWKRQGDHDQNIMLPLFDIRNSNGNISWTLMRGREPRVSSYMEDKVNSKVKNISQVCQEQGDMTEITLHVFTDGPISGMNTRTYSLPTTESQTLFFWGVVWCFSAWFIIH